MEGLSHSSLILARYSWFTVYACIAILAIIAANLGSIAIESPPILFWVNKNASDF